MRTAFVWDARNPIAGELPPELCTSEFARLLAASVLAGSLPLILNLYADETTVDKLYVSSAD